MNLPPVVGLALAVLSLSDASTTTEVRKKANEVLSAELSGGVPDQSQAKADEPKAQTLNEEAQCCATKAERDDAHPSYYVRVGYVAPNGAQVSTSLRLGTYAQAQDFVNETVATILAGGGRITETAIHG